VRSSGATTRPENHLSPSRAHSRLDGLTAFIDRVLERLLTAADASGMIDWAVSVDSTIARAHQHATNVTRHTGAGSNYTIRISSRLTTP
jgi:hypothetical protein